MFHGEIRSQRSREVRTTVGSPARASLGMKVKTEAELLGADQGGRAGGPGQWIGPQPEGQARASGRTGGSR